MIPIVRGGKVEYAMMLREYAKIDETFLKTLNVKSVDEIKFDAAEKMLGKDSFDKEGEFTPKGRNLLKEILSEVGLSMRSTVDDYAKRLAFFVKNPEIKNRLDELHSLVDWFYGYQQSPKNLSNNTKLLCQKIMGPWTEKSLAKNLGTDESMEKCFSLLNRP